MHHNGTPTRAAWTQQEDAMLRAAVDRFGERDWASVSTGVPGRSAKSCSDRWRNFLSPDIAHPRKNPFSPWEVAVVVEAHKEYSNNWKTIALLLPGRTNRAVKNLYVGNMKKGERLPRRGENKYLDQALPLHALLSVPEQERGTPLPCTTSDMSDDGEEGSEGGCAWEEAPSQALPAEQYSYPPQGYPQQQAVGYGGPTYGYAPYGGYSHPQGEGAPGAAGYPAPCQLKGEGEGGMGGSQWSMGAPGAEVARAGGGGGRMVAGVKRGGDLEGGDAEAYPQVAAARSPKRHRGGDAAPATPRASGSRRGSLLHQAGSPHPSSSSSNPAGRGPLARSRLGRSLTGSGAAGLGLVEAPVTPMSHQVAPGDGFAPVPEGLPSIRTGIGYGSNWTSCELLVPPDTGRRVSAGLAGPYATLGGTPFSPLGPLQGEGEVAAPPAAQQALLLPPASISQQQQQVAGPGTPFKAAPLQVQLTAAGSTSAAPSSPFSVTTVQAGAAELAPQQQLQAALEVQYIQVNNHMYCQQQLVDQAPQHYQQQQHHQQQQLLAAPGNEGLGDAILQQLQYPSAQPASVVAAEGGAGVAAGSGAAARGGSLMPGFGMSPGSSLNLDFQTVGAANGSLLDFLGDTPVTPPGDACSLDLSQGPLLAVQPKPSLEAVSWLEMGEGKEGEGGEAPWLDLVGAPTAGAGCGGAQGGEAAAYRMSSVAAADGWVPRRLGRHSGSASGGSSHGSPIHPSHHHHHHAAQEQQQAPLGQHAMSYYPRQHNQAAVQGYGLGAGDRGEAPGDGKFLVPQQQQQPQQQFTAQQAAYMHLMGHGPDATAYL